MPAIWRTDTTLQLKVILGLWGAFTSPATAEAFSSIAETTLSQNQHRDWAKNLSAKTVKEGFFRLTEQDGVNYLALPTNKAGAACIYVKDAWLGGNPLRVKFWGSKWKSESLEQAQEAALNQCTKARDKYRSINPVACDCQLAFAQNEFSYQPLDTHIDKLITWVEERQVAEICPEDIETDPTLSVSEYDRRSSENLKCGGDENPEFANFRFTINGLPNKSTLEGLPKIYPNPPIVKASEIERLDLRNPSNNNKIYRGVRLYPEVGDNRIRTWLTDLSLPPGWHYSFDIHRVPNEREGVVLARLSELDGSGLYGVFQQLRNSDIELPFFRDEDQLARYVRTYDLTDRDVYEALESSLAPEESYGGLVDGEKSQKLWIEAVVPVDGDLIPVGTPSRSVTPIAIQTDKALYIYSEKIWPSRGGPGAVVHFDGEVFDLSGCNDMVLCVQQATMALKAELVTLFENLPISAKIVADHRPSSQIRFQRRFKRSELLRGFAGPYYELSTYTITIWPGPAEDFVGSAELYFASKSQGDEGVRAPTINRIFMHVDHSLQISVGEEGSYKEPTIRQYAKYTDLVTEKVKVATANATSSLRGTLTPTGVGVLSN